MIKIILSMSTWKIKTRFSNWKIKPQKWIAGLLLNILSFLSSKEKFVLENSHASCDNIVIVRADVVSMSFLLLDERLSEWVCNTRRSYIKPLSILNTQAIESITVSSGGLIVYLITAFFKFDRRVFILLIWRLISNMCIFTFMHLFLLIHTIIIYSLVQAGGCILISSIQCDVITIKYT